MEIRLIIISDTQQPTPHEFKSFKEAAEFCLGKDAGQEVIVEKVGEVQPSLPGEGRTLKEVDKIAELDGSMKPSFLERYFTS